MPTLPADRRFIQNMKTAFCIILLCLVADIGYAQSTDIVIHKRHYTARAYYSDFTDDLKLGTAGPETILYLGNYENGLKTGHWRYYYPTGLVLAEGYYEKGVKAGKWKYYDTNGAIHHIIRFSTKEISTEKVVVNAMGFPELYDYIHTNNTEYHLVNGRRPPSPHTVILD